MLYVKLEPLILCHCELIETVHNVGTYVIAAFKLTFEIFPLLYVYAPVTVTLALDTQLPP